MVGGGQGVAAREGENWIECEPVSFAREGREWHTELGFSDSAGLNYGLLRSALPTPWSRIVRHRSGGSGSRVGERSESEHALN